MMNSVWDMLSLCCLEGMEGGSLWSQGERNLTSPQKSSQPFQQIMLEQLDIHMQKMGLNLYLTLYIKIN